MARSAVCTSPPYHRGAPRLGDGTTSLCHLHHLVGPYHPLALGFPITVMPMILNCFCLSLLRTTRSRRGSRTVWLIYPHGRKITTFRGTLPKPSCTSSQPTRSSTITSISILAPYLLFHPK